MERPFLAYSWFNYFLDAVDQYSLHSPFLFDLYNSVFRDDIHEADFNAIEAERKKLLSEREIIGIQDFGTGSSKLISISKIAKNSLTRPKYSRLLVRLMRLMKSRQTLELGTSLGINTSYLAQHAEQVVTMEGCPEAAALASRTFNNLGLSNIEIIQGNIDETLKSTLDRIDRLDFVYVDANHTSEGIIRYFNMLKSKIHSNSVVVFDDIYWSKDMNLGWKELRNDPAVTISIDNFQFGILLFKKEVATQQVTLWY